ncbi:MAG: NAD(P)-binding domain-containing protein [Alphaproteobacteria bacterium]|nr:NAD(P)-binding domain-containing protein [Alphaproteobacteria bacterium]
MLYYWPYFFMMAGVLYYYFKWQRQTESTSLAVQTAAVEAGLTEPASLHPSVDPDVCIGCGTCVRACPENHVLGIINGKVSLIEPTHCIGHGACKTACPMDAIDLVFGTATRGVDLPLVGPDFQTNVPGVFIAGELGGMGLIRNAVEQGKQAVENIRKLPGLGQQDRLDVIIIGAGPAGFSAALAAKQAGLSYLVLEQDDLGGTVFKYPRGKVVMTAPAKLPIVGQTNFREVSKETLLEFWKKIEGEQQLQISYRERVEKVVAAGDGFEVHSTVAQRKCRALLLAIGRRGTPRQLGVAGEDQKKVVYQLIDPEQYKGMHVLVVGGGDSALEAATSIAEQPGTTVTLSYRSEAFGRAKSKNREKVAAQQASGRLTVRLKSTVKTIGEKSLDLAFDGQVQTIANEAVIVCAGGILPTEFLKSIGITMDTKYGTA